ncbi:MAG: Chromosome partitioning protein ParB [Betaproteobacteria bacterium]|jgi:ParB family chromosome partitioning protein|nr:Chromosome partitioning protein ParB [Betaproteobacteria bacterium]MEA3158175.1 ParB family transcriptional regulator, chromosome partitioning protein [Betaproteobacteria bacterium]
MVKAKGLGRGLDALLGDDDPPPRAEDGLRNIGIDELQSGKYQPRSQMAQTALAELAESIKSQGVMQPILVRTVSPGRYEIVAGERRWRAARMAGLKTVPALVKEIPDQQALAAALIENIQREDLNPLEEATGIQRLTQEFGLTHQAIADTLGRSRAAVTNLLRLLELAPPVRELLAEGRLDMGHARALLALPVARQIELAREAALKGLSVREVEQRVAIALKDAQPRRPRVDRDITRLEEEWSDRLGTTVQIKPRGKRGGKLMLAYRSLDELEHLLQKLARLQ